VWSLGITLLELGLNRFPIGADGDAPMGPIDLITFLLHADLPALEDDEERKIKWSRSLRDFINRCLVRDGTERLSPRALIPHQLVRRAEAIPMSDMARFVATVWKWPLPPPS